MSLIEPGLVMICRLIVSNPSGHHKRVYQDLSGSDQSRYLQKVSQFRMMNLPGSREK